MLAPKSVKFPEREVISPGDSLNGSMWKSYDIQASGTGGGNSRIQRISFDFTWMLKLLEGEQSGH